MASGNQISPHAWRSSLDAPTSSPDMEDMEDMEYQSEDPMLTASQIQGAIPSSQYSWRPPSPPHIGIPPTPDNDQLVLPKYSELGSSAEEREILSSIVNASNVICKSRDWRYEWRRQMQPILSFLYLGPSSAAKDIETLKKEAITMLLVIRDIKTAEAKILSGEKVAKALGIEAAAVDVDGNQELIAAFPKAVNIINNHLITMYRRGRDNEQMTCSDSPKAAEGKVLVFCESGNERSATVVAAYLMAMHDINIVGAVQYIQTQRFCVAFDDALKHLLRSYQDILHAGRTVNTSQATESPTVSTKLGGKRGREEMLIGDDNNDMVMDHDADDYERFGNRGFAPFS